MVDEASFSPKVGPILSLCDSASLCLNVPAFLGALDLLPLLLIP